MVVTLFVDNSVSEVQQTKNLMNMIQMSQVLEDRSFRIEPLTTDQKVGVRVPPSARKPAESSAGSPP
jgi:hypothetical protein